MNIEPHWTSYISVFLVPIIAFIGISIAYRQSKTAQNKLKFELFEKRLEVYNSCTDFITNVMGKGNCTDKDLIEFRYKTKSARWLFDKKLYKYLNDELYSKTIDLQCIHSELKDIPRSEERSKKVQEQSDIKKWLLNQYDILDEKFSPYLELTH
jgi:hypothetical protein